MDERVDIFDEKGKDKICDKARIAWIDYARAFAVLLVILNHSVETTIPLNINSYTAVSIFEGVGAIILFSLGRVGVPVFLCLTGFLLLDRDWDSEKIVVFWKKKWLYLLIVTEIWVNIYNFYFILYEHRTITFTTWVKDILFLKLSDLPHVYYMPMILGMYILLPLVGIALRKIDIKILVFPIAIYVMMQFIIPTISIFTSVSGDNLHSAMNYGFSGGEFGLYIIVGYIIKKLPPKKISWIAFVPIAYGSFICAIALQMWCYTQGLAYYLWYNNVFLLIYSTMIVYALSKIKRLPLLVDKILSDIARKSFGIYLTHVLILRVLFRFISYNVGDVKLQMLVYLIGGLIFSWLLVTLLSKIPLVGKKIFYM